MSETKPAPGIAKAVLSRHVDSTGHIQWPTDQVERAELARALFGRSVSRYFDYWLVYALDFLHYPEARQPHPEKSPHYDQDKWLRERTKTFTPEQRHAVEALLTMAMHGAMFSLVVEADQPRENAELKIAIADERGELVGLGQPDQPELGDLHDCFHDWLTSFSRYGKARLGGFAHEQPLLGPPDERV